MTITLTQVDELQDHLRGIFERSAHHAGDVNEVLLSLIGAMMWRKNPKDDFKVNTKEGAGGNVIWFRVDSTRYVLLYNHESQLIELVEGARKGTVLHTFNNQSTTNEVSRVFASLGHSVPELSKAVKVRKEDRDPNAPKVKSARKLAKAAEKDPEAKLARQQAKADKDPQSKAAQLEAKAAKVQARDAKVKAQRAKRRSTRADEKAARVAAAEAAVAAAAADGTLPAEAAEATTGKTAS